MFTVAAIQSAPLVLGIPGFTQADLFAPERLRALFERWHEALASDHPALAARYDAYRATQGADLAPAAISALLVELAPHVSRFVIRLFGCEREWDAQRKAVDEQ